MSNLRVSKSFSTGNLLFTFHFLANFLKVRTGKHGPAFRDLNHLSEFSWGEGDLQGAPSSHNVDPLDPTFGQCVQGIFSDVSCLKLLNQNPSEQKLIEDMQRMHKQHLFKKFRQKHLYYILSIVLLVTDIQKEFNILVKIEVELVQ